MENKDIKKYAKTIAKLQKNLELEPENKKGLEAEMTALIEEFVDLTNRDIKHLIALDEEIQNFLSEKAWQIKKNMI